MFQPNIPQIDKEHECTSERLAEDSCIDWEASEFYDFDGVTSIALAKKESVNLREFSNCRKITSTHARQQLKSHERTQQL